MAEIPVLLGAAYRADGAGRRGMRELGAQDVELWWGRLPRGEPESDLWLSSEERARVERFVHEEARRRRVGARVALRAVLSLYLGIAPREVRLVTLPGGKPALENQALEFNLSHSRDYLLIGAARTALGVDVEEERPSLPYSQLAARVCSPREEEMLGQLPDGQARGEFVRLWTRKEAVLKATGEGMRRQMRSCEVVEELSAGWRIYSIKPQAGLWMAAAVHPDCRAPRILPVEWSKEGD